jgi:hypothetical protein
MVWGAVIAAGASLAASAMSKKGKSRATQQTRSGFETLPDDQSEFATGPLWEDIVDYYDSPYQTLPTTRYIEEDPIFRSGSLTNLQSWSDMRNQGISPWGTPNNGMDQGAIDAAVEAAVAKKQGASNARQYILEQMALEQARGGTGGGRGRRGVRPYRDFLEREDVDWGRMGEIMDKYPLESGRVGSYRGTYGDPYIGAYLMGDDKDRIKDYMEKIAPLRGA